jgi:hypothetical protein
VVTKNEYAKWMLEDPRVNFAISERARPMGVDHLGIQVEHRAELIEVYACLKRAEGTVIEEGRPETAKPCCTSNQAA